MYVLLVGWNEKKKCAELEKHLRAVFLKEG
jgi:hypothetical protein